MNDSARNGIANDGPDLVLKQNDIATELANQFRAQSGKRSKKGQEQNGRGGHQKGKSKGGKKSWSTNQGQGQGHAMNIKGQGTACCQGQGQMKEGPAARIPGYRGANQKAAANCEM